MRYTQIGSEKVSVIGLGTWQYGAKEWGWEPSQRGAAVGIIRRAMELGINLIDTAEAYARGESERIIGEALDGSRERAFLATKFLPLWPLPGRIRRAAARSLERLRTDQVDLYQIHWPNPVIPLRTQMKAMRGLCDAGLVRHLGVSNFSLGMWRGVERRARCPVVSNQVQYNLLKRGPEKMLPWAQAQGRVIIAYSPLAQGLLSGKYRPDNAPGGVRKINALFTRANMAAAAPVLASVREIAGRHGSTPAQIALAWLVHHPGVIAIPGARSVAQLEENAAAADIRLSEEEFARLNEVSAAFRRAGWRALPQWVRRLVRKDPSPAAI